MHEPHPPTVNEPPSGLPRAAGRAADYWARSREPLTALVFIAPLLVVYEIGVLALGAQAVRNGADLWMRGLLELLDFGQYFLLPVLTVGILLGWHYATRRRWRVLRGVLSGMLVESVLLAICLRLILQVELILWRALTPAPLTAGSPQPVADLADSWGRMIGFLGAGVYEELLFRLILLSLVGWGIRRLGMTGGAGAMASVAATSVMFAAAHYVGPYGNAVDLLALTFWFGFVFRFLAGAFFGALFLCRGFGIAVGSHAGYDILVKLI